MRQPLGHVARHAFEEIASTKTYLYSPARRGARLLELMPDFTISGGRSFTESRWALAEGEDGVAGLCLLGQARPSCHLRRTEGGAWEGHAAGDGSGVALTPVMSTATPEERAFYRRLREEALSRVGVCPRGVFAGRGIVIAGGGTKYFPGAWVSINVLRRLVNCELPIELWHLGPGEIDGPLRALVEPLGVKCVDAHEVRRRHPVRRLGGWGLKPFSIAYSRFREVFYLDADNVPLVDPGLLFDTPEFKETGALFWPDFGRLSPLRSIWEICEVEYRDEPEFESGQIAVDKQRHWDALQLTIHLNEHADFYYKHVNGDKETFHMAWRMLGHDYCMTPHPLSPLDCTMRQHNFAGAVIFQHRYGDKFSLGRGRRIEGFRFEDECYRFLEELRARWDGRIRGG